MEKNKISMCDELEKIEILTHLCNSYNLETIRKIPQLIQADFIKNSKKVKQE